MILIKGLKPHPSADVLNPIIGIDPRVEPAYRRQGIEPISR